MQSTKGHMGFYAFSVCDTRRQYLILCEGFTCFYLVFDGC